MTQDELSQLITAMKQVFPTKTEVATKEDIQNLITKDEFSEQIKRLYKMLEYLPSKDHFDKRMDELIKEIKTVREEQTLLSNQVSNHTDRLTVIEEAVHIQIP
jgi:hypothetical protein